MFLEKIDIPGEHAFTFSGAVGTLQGMLMVPESGNMPITHVAILGHPHSLYGGTMQNKVITSMAKAFKEQNIPSLRFNFRGVDKSQGEYDAGKGESEDMLLLARLWLNELPHTALIFAGFSFGSYVTYRAAAQQKNDLLLSIAPAVHHYDYQAFQPRPDPWIIIQGTEDEVVSSEQVWQFSEQAHPPIPVISMPEASHFFHGKLIELRSHIENILKKVNIGS